MKKALLLLLGVLIALPNIAYGFSYKYEGQTVSYEVIDDISKFVEVTNNRHLKGDLILPEKVLDSRGTEYTIKQIASDAFRDAKLTSVTLPEGVTTICSQAFASCKELKSINFPKSVTLNSATLLQI